MQNRRQLLALAAATGAWGSLPALARAATASGSALAPVLQKIADDILVHSPEQATGLGLDRGALAPLASQLSDLSVAERARDAARSEGYRKQLTAIDRAKLSDMDKTRYDTMLFALDLGREGRKFGYGYAGLNGGVPYVVSQQGGTYSQFAEFLDSQQHIETPADVEAYLTRLAGTGKQLDQETDAIRADAAKGVVLPDFLIANTVGQQRGFRATPAAQQRVVTNLKARALKVGAPDPTARATELVEKSVYPALDRQTAVLAGLKADDRAGVWKLPDGDAYYRWLLKGSTTTDLDAETIHQTGLRQNEEIGAEMDALLKAQGLTQGSVGERTIALARDPRFAFPDTDAGRAAVIAYCQGSIDKVRAMMPKLSKMTLKADVQVKRVPADIQDGAALGYMNFASLDGSRPAIYYINLKDMSFWPRFQLASLTAHEGLPGHAWQGAYIAEHAKELPLISSLLGFNAFVEGWALYAEQLVDESGAYADDPWSRLGYLQAQRFRAVRLVVDTGLHAKRWSRDKAIDFMVANTGRSKASVTSEIDRYCASPGQACGYKIGHNEIIRLRAAAKAKTGAAFDVRDFNDAVVQTGGVPLSVLGKVIERRFVA